MRTPLIKAPHLPSGTEDFVKMRRYRVDGKLLTVADKTFFLPELLNSVHDVVVFTRPIRFMKSSTLSMIKSFVSIKDAEDNKSLFEGLAISDKAHAEFRARYQGQFPVIHLTFKNIRKRSSTWPEAERDLSKMMAGIYEEYSYILPSLTKVQQEQYQRIINNKAADGDLEASLADMATYLSKYYQRKVIILIDEYDTPLHRAHIRTKKEERRQGRGYFGLMSSFMVAFLGGALKSHPCVEKSFMTGVLRTSFASLASSLNNAKVYSVLSPKFAELFGFTEAEVKSFVSQIEGVNEQERQKIMKSLQSWYNGYYVGSSAVRMYNPWSVAQFFDDLPTSKDFSAGAHWLQTGDSMALFEYLRPRFDRIIPKLTKLMEGETIQVELDEKTRLLDLDDPLNDRAFWGILLHAGYLSASDSQQDQDTIFNCDVSIPNYEVKGAYARLINRYHEEVLFADNSGFENYKSMIVSLQTGNIDDFVTRLQLYIEQVVSYHDIPKSAGEHPSIKIREQVYHGFMLGVLVGLHSKYYKLSSNLEAGYGRYDIVMAPRKSHQHGLIFEFKAASSQDKLALEAKNALRQITAKSYATALKAKGVESGINIGMSFYGKSLEVSYTKEDYSLVLA